jgi:hypothetical protein
MATEHTNNGDTMNITETTKTPATLIATNNLNGFTAGSRVSGLVVKSIWVGSSLTSTAPTFTETSYEIDGMNYPGSDFAKA